MKKVFAVLALVGVLASCKDKKDEKKEDVKSDTAVVTTPPPTDPGPTTDNTAVPKFADAEVQKYVDDYTAFVNGYVAAYKSKDMTKITEWSTKATEWASKTQTITMKLANSPEEATKFSNYMAKLSQDMAAAMTPQ